MMQHNLLMLWHDAGILESMEDHQHTKPIAPFHQANYTFLLVVYATNNLELWMNHELNFHEQW